MRHAILLRGINVGGINIKMVDLRNALTTAGFGDVCTVLSTGNVLLDSDLSGPALKTSVETVLSETFGYEAWVIVLEPATVQTIVDFYPFDATHDGWHPYVIFGNDPTHLDELTAIADTLDPELERIDAGDGVVYWEVVKGNTTGSVVGKFMAKAKYKPTTTTRNLRTLTKMLA